MPDRGEPEKKEPGKQEEGQTNHTSNTKKRGEALTVLGQSTARKVRYLQVAQCERKEPVQ